MSSDVEDADAGDDTVPRDPTTYRPAIHFGERFYDKYDSRKRHLDGDIVEGCIRRGEPTKVGRDEYHVRETFGGVTFRLVVDVDDREVITGYPISVNTDAAQESGRWSSRQIDEIREFIANDPRQD